MDDRGRDHERRGKPVREGPRALRLPRADFGARRLKADSCGLGSGCEPLENVPVHLTHRASRLERLDADVRGAGVAVRLDALADRLLVAPRDEGIDQLVAAAVLRDLVFGKPVLLPHVVQLGHDVVLFFIEGSPAARAV